MFNLKNPTWKKSNSDINKPPINYIISGYERGGTTLLSEIFRANGFESGFECGVLMARKPKEMYKIEPYWTMLLKGWGISEETRREAASGDFAHFYKTICKEAFPTHSGPFFDKTPIYMSQIGLCLHRAPFAKGAIVIHRDPRAVFLSMSKRLSPELAPDDAVEQNFQQLTNRYIRYFEGCISHHKSPKVLFVPFEELVTREDSWLNIIGNFVNQKKFGARNAPPRYSNVSSKTTDLTPVHEYSELLSKSTQKKILEATKIASVFFADPIDRAKYAPFWGEIKESAEKIIKNHQLPNTLTLNNGVYFEPFTYLIKNPDVREAKTNPVDHFINVGTKEGRTPF